MAGIDRTYIVCLRKKLILKYLSWRLKVRGRTQDSTGLGVAGL
jgi:hypothetical protein